MGKGLNALGGKTKAAISLSMAGRAGRTYKRDGRGRFASTGGGGSSKKAPKTTSARGRAQANERKAAAALKAATKAGDPARKAAKSALVAKKAREFYRRSETGTKRSAAKAAVKVVAKAKPTKMSKAPANKAKVKYKAATSAAREARMIAGGRTSTKGLGKRTDAGAQRIRANVKVAQAAAAKVRRMESKRKA
jgi:hypothetical protein